MRQIFLTYGFADTTLMQKAASNLTEAGFAVTASQRVGYSINIRVREGTKDEETVVRIVELVQPTALRFPPVAPTSSLEPYRDGLA